MATPVDSDRLGSLPRARSGLPVDKLAAGLIAEETQINNLHAAVRNPAVPDFLAGRPRPATFGERILQSFNKAIAWSESQFRRAVGKSTYAEAITRQSERRQKEIGEELWRRVERDKGLIRRLHNNELPHTWNLITEKANIKIQTLREAPERVAPKLRYKNNTITGPASLVSTPPTRKVRAKRDSYQPELLQRNSFIADANAAWKFVNSLEPLVEDPHGLSNGARRTSKRVNDARNSRNAQSITSQAADRPQHSVRKRK
ncbi:hypothetical protein [Streptomyces sp. H23]|uniref:hypothetical protein n=1 Tax=Streptomyces sp. H23 TaxID=2541723 RepID=UPI00106E4A08|nr:hypothetical protein [Streptomyces sp. H23]